MKMTQHLRILSLLTIFAVAVGFGQKVGTTSLQFLKVMPTARAVGMGEAFVSMASGADAVFWNPAGLCGARRQEFATTLTLWLFDTKQSALGYALPLGNLGTIGLQLQYVDYGNIEETTRDQLGFYDRNGTTVYYGPTGRVFSPQSYVVGLSYARQLTDQFSTGLSVKYVSESLYDVSDVVVTITDPITGLTTQKTVKTYSRLLLFDFGMHYRTGYHSVEIAAAVQNFGSEVTFAEESFPAPMVFRLGAKADIVGEDGLGWDNPSNRLTVAYDMIQPNDYLQQMHLGLEYAFSNTVFLRGGYKFNYDSDGLTLGAGASTELAGLFLGFDYSYSGMGEYLPNVHRLSLGVKIK